MDARHDEAHGRPVERAHFEVEHPHAGRRAVATEIRRSRCRRRRRTARAAAGGAPIGPGSRRFQAAIDQEGEDPRRARSAKLNRHDPSAANAGESRRGQVGGRKERHRMGTRITAEIGHDLSPVSALAGPGHHEIWRPGPVATRARDLVARGRRPQHGTPDQCGRTGQFDAVHRGELVQRHRSRRRHPSRRPRPSAAESHNRHRRRRKRYAGSRNPCAGQPGRRR